MILIARQGFCFEYTLDHAGTTGGPKDYVALQNTAGIFKNGFYQIFGITVNANNSFSLSHNFKTIAGETYIEGAVLSIEIMADGRVDFR